MTDMVDILHRRFQLIGYSAGHMPDGLVWRWQGFDHGHKINLAAFKNAGADLDYRRSNDPAAALFIGNIHPLGQLLNPKEELIPLGPPETVDGVKIDIENWGGLTPQAIPYNGGFDRGTRREEVEFKNFTESLEVSAKFTQGGEAAQFKFEQEVKTGFQANHGDEQHDEKSEGQRKDAGAAPEAAPGCDNTFWMTRTVQKMKVRRSGVCQVTHSIDAGKHWHGKWATKKGGYKRHAHWDTFEDFLAVVKGAGRRDHDGAAHFRAHPMPGWVIAELEKPLPLPFVDESPPFDGWTNLRGHKELVRGPNPEILEKLKQLTDAGG